MTREELLKERDELEDRLLQINDAVMALAQAALAHIRNADTIGARTYLTALLRLMAEERESLLSSPGAGDRRSSRFPAHLERGEG